MDEKKILRWFVGSVALLLGLWVWSAPLVAEALKLPPWGLPGWRVPAGSYR